MAIFASPYRLGVAVCTVAVLSGCAVTTQGPAPEISTPVYSDAFQSCTVVSQDEKAVGNWLSVRKESGIPGELRLQVQLLADGSMQYVEQLKRGNKPPQSLEETGCWYREEGTLILRSTHSNELLVDAQDPIYINRYAILELDAKGMTLDMQGKSIHLRRVKSDYRLPIL